MNGAESTPSTQMSWASARTYRFMVTTLPLQPLHFGLLFSLWSSKAVNHVANSTCRDKVADPANLLPPAHAGRQMAVSALV
jgi:hypothetical protein